AGAASGIPVEQDLTDHAGPMPFEVWFAEQVRGGLSDLKAGRVVTDEVHWKKWHAMRIRGVSRVQARLPLIWSAAAEADVAWIARLSPQDLLRPIDAIEKAVLDVRMHPRFGRAGRVKGTREVAVNGMNFTVVYQTAFRQFVEIVRILPTERH